jgi:hypothetical protein
VAIWSGVFLIPQVEGAQWELGAVGNAEWTGVPLGALLERFEAKAAASANTEKSNGALIPNQRVIENAKRLNSPALASETKRG